MKHLKNSIFNYWLLIAAVGSTAVLFSCTARPGPAAGTKVHSAEALAQGKTIFENSCAKCHDLPAPEDHSARDWVGIMNSMAPKAKLSEQQHDQVYNYIVSVIK